MALEADFDLKNGIIDSETPVNSDLAALYKQSFAYHTFRVRSPEILASIVTSLAEDKDDLIATYGSATCADIEKISADITKLRSDILANATMLLFKDNEPDTAQWNAFLKQLPAEKRSYYTACWLYAECYMYRKIYSIFRGSATLGSFDYFRKQKHKSAEMSIDVMVAVTRATRESVRNERTFQKLLKLNLWGNRCDLSITSGKQVTPKDDAFEIVAELDANLLVDRSDSTWKSLESACSVDSIVEIILDNSGYELFTDLILAEYIIDKGLACKVRFNVKAIPWFISDVMVHDYHWKLDFLAKHENELLRELGKKLQLFTAQGKFEVAPMDYYWTSPYEFFRMQQMQPALYERLAKAKLLIIKGDLNYRKLIGDYNWNHTEAFETCLRGFRPTNLCTLRTIKAHLICGLPPGKSEELFAKNKEWMLTGEYGVIQFASN
ncbi:damage-control phosphatase ARMT1-like [Scaptodrosophila lebanonensis]|uniref:Sugar phosphate phosphatase n=1 Tax=Drosophila lebanonensis TaxID=7225 RepID=A0A6J2UC00_DROLE|nr:damage-control phosphatase ARMT1-like [Scaptodrosophila lebanonensis]